MVHLLVLLVPSVLADFTNWRDLVIFLKITYVLFHDEIFINKIIGIW